MFYLIIINNFYFSNSNNFLMKKPFIIFIFLIYSCSAPKICPYLVYDSTNKISYNSDGALFTGRCLTYDNDSKRSIQQYINGKDYGKWIFYFSNGQIETKGKFNKSGERIGTWKYFNENGTKKQISKYSNNGERFGTWVEYDNNGVVIRKINY